MFNLLLLLLIPTTVQAQSLRIPSIDVETTVHTAGKHEWDRQDWLGFEEQAQSVLEKSPFLYPYHSVIAAHDYREFSKLHTLEYNDLVIFDAKRYRVRHTDVVSDTDTQILLNPFDLTLQTCFNGTSQRFLVYLSLY